MSRATDDSGSFATAGSLADLAALSDAPRTPETLYRQDPFVQGTGTKRGGFNRPIRPVVETPSQERRAEAGKVRHKTTADYPTQGKLIEQLAAAGDVQAGEPAERLFVALVVGDNELGSALLRNLFRVGRVPAHEAMVYQWRGSFTFDVIGFDAIDEKTGAGQVDLMLLSDQILGPSFEGDAYRDLEKVSLEARFKFPEAYLVAVCADEERAWSDAHPFNSVEAKAGARDVAVFDHRLVGRVTPTNIDDLLLAFARSERYADHRNVWTQPEDGGPLQPTPKGLAYDIAD